MASRLPLLRRISKLLKSPPLPPLRSSSYSRPLRFLLPQASTPIISPSSFASSRTFCSNPLNLPQEDFHTVVHPDLIGIIMIKLGCGVKQLLESELEQLCGKPVKPFVDGCRSYDVPHNLNFRNLFHH